MHQPASTFKALADETRLRIISLLLAEGELCVCDLIAAIKLPQSTVSRHLAYLRKTGWVNDRRCGSWMYYSIAQSDSTFQKELLDFLRRQAAAFPATCGDLERLECFGKDSGCI